MQSEQRSRRACTTPRLLEAAHIRAVDSAWRCRVLVVDDDATVTAQLTRLLRGAGYDVRAASSGAEALHALDISHCEILLTDWQMPGMNGLELCRNVRLRQQQGEVYVMMLSVRDQQQDRLFSVAEGIDDYVVKGAPVNEILARLKVARRVTQRERARRDAERQIARPIARPLSS